jgi:hypothetical protein
VNPVIWLTDAIQILTFFVIGPVLAAAIAFSALRGILQNAMPERFRVLCVASGATAFLRFAFAKWINADVRTPWYFLQVACVLFSGLRFGVFMGCGASVLLRSSRWQ